MLNIYGGMGVMNIILGYVMIDFNFCFLIVSILDGFKVCVYSILDVYGFDYMFDWMLGGELFLIE